MISNMPTGGYVLPALSEYTVTETIYPDPDLVKPKMTIADWVLDNNIPYRSSLGKQVYIAAPYPDDVELVFDSVDDGYTYVFNDGRTVSA